MTDTKAKAKDKSFLDKLGEKAIEQVVDKAADKFIVPILNYIGEFCTEFSGYLADFDEHVKQLELACPGLTATGNRLRNNVQRALLNSTNMKQSAKVDEWYEKEKVTAADAAKLVDQGKREDGRLCLGKCCVGRFFYGKNVVKCCKRLRGVKEEGDKLFSDQDFLEQGAPDGEELLSSFEDKFRNLTRAIICIESLKKEVKRRLEASTPGYGPHDIESWLVLVDLELREGNSLTSKKEEHLKEFQNRGSGSSSAIQRKVSDCTDRIVKYHGKGEIHLEALTAGPSYSSNEVPPQPLPQPA